MELAMMERLERKRAQSSARHRRRRRKSRPGPAEDKPADRTSRPTRRKGHDKPRDEGGRAHLADAVTACA